MTDQTSSLTIGLLDNSCHSLKRGYEMWSQWKRSEDAWLLKESIIWVHHGIELAFKQLLVQTNEYLVFDDVDRAIERLRILRRKKGMENAGILDLFDYDDKVMSVGFRNLVERTAIALSIPELAEAEPLRVKINELTKYRNKVVHFSIELDIAAISNLLSEIVDPLLSVLAREVEDVYFNNGCIPEIRQIAQPVQQYSEQIRLEIVDNAIKATLNALPPKGNRRAGIVWQTIGSGLGATIVSYLMQVRLLPRIRDNHVIVVVDRTELAMQIHQRISDLASQANTVEIALPESKSALSEALKSEKPKIIVSTIQKFDLGTIATDKECLLVVNSLHALSERLLMIFPNAIHILFTNIPPQTDSRLLRTFGEVVGKYDLTQAIYDGISKPVKIERRKIKTLDDYSTFALEYSETDLSTSFSNSKMSAEFVAKLARDIVQHFEARQRNWIGKGIVVVANRETGAALLREVNVIRPNWYGDTEFTGSVKTVSAIDNSMQRAILFERFREQADSLFLMIATGSMFIGLDNPLVHTIYITSSISLQLRHRLAGLVSRPYPGKEDQLIVDYIGLNWDLE